MNRLADFTTLTASSRSLGVTIATLKAWADKGIIRAVRDDAGRRLLFREDVERIARERATRSGRPRRRGPAHS